MELDLNPGISGLKASLPDVILPLTLVKAFVFVHMLFPLPRLPSPSHSPGESLLILQDPPALCGFP